MSLVSIEPKPAASAGIPTRELLIETAERLFAERGIHGVSLREIGLAAGQRNNGVTQYHFGDKAGLVVAIFERRAAEVNARRLRAAGGGASRRTGSRGPRPGARPSSLPLAEQVEQRHAYVRFLSRLQTDGHRDLLLSAGGRRVVGVRADRAAAAKTASEVAAA